MIRTKTMWRKTRTLGSTLLPALVLTAFFAAPVRAQAPGGLRGELGSPALGAEPAQRLSARAIVSHSTVVPGGTFHVAVEMTVAKDTWLYGPVPGGTVTAPPIPLRIRAAPGELAAEAVLFAPTSEHVTRYPDGKLDVHNVYEPTGYAFLPVTVPAAAEPGRYEVSLKVDGLVCEQDGQCVPVQQDLTASVEVGAAAVASPDWTERLTELLAESKTAEEWAAPPAHAAEAEVREADVPGLTAAAGLGLAVLAGLILNVMPCVLPVIPLRLFALLEQARESRRRFITLGLAFAGGILLFFVGIAAANVLLKLTLAYTLKWGDMFRHPEFIVAMVLLLVALAVNMFGVFTVTVPGRIASAEAGGGHLGAVGMGLLMAILSTPCSFAILAAAFGWAQAQNLVLGTVGILLIGVGMAAPHAVLAAFPKAVRRIPRAGRWTELLKEFVGFVLLLVAIWLLAGQMDRAYPAWVLGYGVVLAMCLWVWGRWVRHDDPARRKWPVRGGAVILAAAAGWWMLSPPAPPAVPMRPFDAADIARAREAGKTVLVKFTASWCLECKLVDMRVFDDAEMAEALRARGVAAFKGDVSTREMPASEMLYGRLGQPGPPVTAILPPGSAPPILLKGLFSKQDLFDALDRGK